MGKTIFSHTMRVLACDHCAAPLDVALGAQNVTCQYCQATNSLVRRDESADLARARAGPTMSEARRFEILRGQDGRSMTRPASLQHYAPHGVLDAHSAEAAFAEWTRTRLEVKRGASFGAHERLFFLTLLVQDYLSERREDRRCRAMLESALEILDDPRHRQALRGMLACNAARLDDQQAADEWIEGLDPHSDDLYTDSAYRLTRAYVDTTRQRFSEVLTVLGARGDDVPLEDSLEGTCIVLRANAHERLGDVGTAVQQLSMAMGLGPGAKSTLQRVIQINAELQLCAQSLPHVLGQLQQVQHPIETKSATMAAINRSLMIFLAVGLPFAIFTMGIGTLIVLPIFFVALARAKKAGEAQRQALRQHGLRGSAQVTHVESTNTRINNERVMRVHMRVQLPGRMPYPVMHKVLRGRIAQGGMHPGHTVPVLVDPNDATQMVVDA